MKRNRIVLAIAVGVTVLIGVVALVVTTNVLSPKLAALPPSPSRTNSPTVSTAPSPHASQSPAPFNKHQFSLTDPSSDWVLVNKTHPLNPRDYIPSLAQLNLPGYKGEMRPEAATALTSMFAAYHSESGADLIVVSPYRSYVEQVTVYNGWVSRLGKQQADRQSARPGFSEHQTGLAVDIDTATDEGFGKTPAGLWLAANSWRYGFIVRYPEGQEAVTGYEYEPWHFRYVGNSLAAEMHRAGSKSLEAFFGYPPSPTY